MEKYASIPFFLYTKRKEEMLKNIFADGELDYFEKQNRWFEKGNVGFSRLLKRIKEVVNERATPEFVLRNKYPREFEVAQCIPGAESILLKCLLLENGTDNTGSVDYFTSLRKVMEGMFDICRKRRIIPDINELNGCCAFLENKHSDYYIVEGEKIMHEALVYALRYALDMTQDASHNREKLKLRTDEYARETQSNHLFSSVLHVTMDLLLWLSEKMACETERNALKWEEYSILAEVSIESINGGKAYGGGYTIVMNNRMSPLRVGDVVQIKKIDEAGKVNYDGYTLKS